MKTSEKLLLIKKMTTELIVYWIILQRKRKFDLSQQQAFDIDLKAIQQVNFIGHLHQAGIIASFFTFHKEFESIIKDLKNLFYFGIAT